MKISVIMQSFLGDYPGSRKLPKEKFIRAVNSFLYQNHKDRELVIVSDGCEITKKLYELYFSDNEEIKFCYIHRNIEKEKSMYSEEDGIVTYRGIPREVGRAVATGELITYFDTDDIMLPNRLSDLDDFWKDIPSHVMWSSNSVRIINEKALVSDLYLESKARIGDKTFEISNLETKEKEKFFINLTVPDNMVSTASYSICHRREVTTKWKNVTKHKDDLSTPSEDHLFLREMQDNESAGAKQKSASIIICHYRGIWDV